MAFPQFPTLGEARAWLVPDAIALAVAPFRAILADTTLDELVSYLEDAAATHPHYRLLATRAARSLVEPAAQPLAEAARRDERRAPIAVAPKIAGLAPPGTPDLGDPKLIEAARVVIEVHANRFAAKWKYPVEDLISIGWLVAVEVAPQWNGKAAFTTHLWQCVWRRFRDEVTKSSHRYERPYPVGWGDVAKDSDYESDEPEGRFRESMSCAVSSFVLGLPSDETHDAEPRLMRFRDEARLRGICDALPERAQKLIRWVYAEGLTVEEASKRLGISYATGRRAHGEALGALRNAVAEGSNVRPLRRQAGAKN